MAAWALAPPAAVAATGGFERIHRGDMPDPVMTDGSRWAAYRVPARGTHLIDTRSDREHVVATPHGHRAIASVHSGLLMWACDRPRDHAVLLDLKTRARLPLPGLDELHAEFTLRARGSPYYLYFERVGVQWVGGSYVIDYGYHQEIFGSFAVNWHSGERRYDEPQGSHVVPDLDSPGLARRLCSPMERVRDPDRDEPVWERFDYDRPYGLRGKGVSALLLERCGRPTRVLDRCHSFSGCSFLFQIGSGAVSWVAGRRAYLYRLHSGRRTAFHQREFDARGPEDLRR